MCRLWYMTNCGFHTPKTQKTRSQKIFVNRMLTRRFPAERSIVSHIAELIERIPAVTLPFACQTSLIRMCLRLTLVLRKWYASPDGAIQPDKFLRVGTFLWLITPNIQTIYGNSAQHLCNCTWLILFQKIYYHIIKDMHNMEYTLWIWMDIMIHDLINLLLCLFHVIHVSPTFTEKLTRKACCFSDPCYILRDMIWYDMICCFKDLNRAEQFPFVLDFQILHSAFKPISHATIYQGLCSHAWTYLGTFW